MSILGRKISKLTELTTPAANDELAIVDVSVLLFKTKYITVANLFSNIVGPITIGDGGVTDYVGIGATGLLTFLGGAGLTFGSCYGNEIAWSQAAAVQNTWYKISDADMEDGQLRGVTHDGSGQLTVLEPGMYLCNYAWSGGTNTNNDHIQFAIAVNGTEMGAGMNHVESDKANSHQTVSGTAILDLADNATVEISTRTTDNNTPTLSTDHLNFTLVQIGGT